MTIAWRLPLRRATVACAVVILVATLIPRGAGLPLPAEGYDKLGHALAFGVQAALLAACFTAQGWGRGRILVVTLAMTVGYGILTEALQEFVPGRVGSLHDVMADAAGAALGGAPVVFFASLVETNNDETASPADE